MWILLLEAAVALLLLVFIVWWTMFSGRRGGEVNAPPADGEVASTAEDAGGSAGRRTKDSSGPT